ncbi:MAG: hypothetical protein EOO13_18130 [Chitinophagaceae bacterium]|nr:MAG: hypothetical protein EOO13_18130 [Chitinophagaceae bacterium]
MQSKVNTHYDIEIPNDRATTYKVVTFIIILVNVVGFIYFYANRPASLTADIALAGAIISVIAFGFYCFQLYAKRWLLFKIDMVVMILGVIWVVLGNFWLGFLVLLFGMVGFYTNKKTIISFTQEGIKYPSFPPKIFPWAAIDFAMIKDGILTIEMKDNRLFQFTLSPALSEEVDEAAFNKFCQSHFHPALI